LMFFNNEVTTIQVVNIARNAHRQKFISQAHYYRQKSVGDSH
jgi:penicillin-binding protein-related factor A (putative recombinase)